MGLTPKPELHPQPSPEKSLCRGFCQQNKGLHRKWAQCKTRKQKTPQMCHCRTESAFNCSKLTELMHRSYLYSIHIELSQVQNQNFQFYWAFRQTIPVFIPLTRWGTFHLHLSQGSIRVVRLIYSELPTRWTGINFRLLKNRSCTERWLQYNLTDKPLSM